MVNEEFDTVDVCGMRAAGPEDYRVARCMVDLRKIRGNSKRRIALAEKMRMKALQEVSWKYFMEYSCKSEEELNEAFQHFHVNSLSELVKGFVTATFPYMLQLNDADEIIRALQPIKVLKYSLQ